VGERVAEAAGRQADDVCRREPHAVRRPVRDVEGNDGSPSDVSATRRGRLHRHRYGHPSDGPPRSPAGWCHPRGPMRFTELEAHHRLGGGVDDLVDQRRTYVRAPRPTANGGLPRHYHASVAVQDQLDHHQFARAWPRGAGDGYGAGALQMRWTNHLTGIVQANASRRTCTSTRPRRRLQCARDRGRSVAEECLVYLELVRIIVPDPRRRSSRDALDGQIRQTRGAPLGCHRIRQVIVPMYVLLRTEPDARRPQACDAIPVSK